MEVISVTIRKRDITPLGSCSTRASSALSSYKLKETSQSTQFRPTELKTQMRESGKYRNQSKNPFKKRLRFDYKIFFQSKNKSLFKPEPQKILTCRSENKIKRPDSSNPARYTPGIKVNSHIKTKKRANLVIPSLKYDLELLKTINSETFHKTFGINKQHQEFLFSNYQRSSAYQHKILHTEEQ